MFKNTSNKLFCFSPPVMLATFAVEIMFAIYLLWRYKMTTITRLVVVILLALATFQGAEYAICGGTSLQPGLWSRVGYSSISLLPALGLHLVLTIAGKKRPYLVGAAYACAAAFVTYYAFMLGAINGHTCYANYAVFSTGINIDIPYFVYYYGWMAVGVGLAWHYSVTHPSQRAALRAMVLGYLAFIFPTSVINIIDPSTIAGIPSIMCGFAVIFAFLLATRVAPLTITRKDETEQHARRRA